jgi:hypothetical protein
MFSHTIQLPLAMPRALQCAHARSQLMRSAGRQMLALPPALRRCRRQPAEREPQRFSPLSAGSRWPFHAAAAILSFRFRIFAEGSSSSPRRRQQAVTPPLLPERSQFYAHVTSARCALSPFTTASFTPLLRQLYLLRRRAMRAIYRLRALRACAARRSRRHA